MRVLFSSTRGTGHLNPLLPYARALVGKGHEVLVAAPAEVREAVLSAGLEHAPFAHPGGALGPLWARFKTLSPEEQTALAAREIFAGANARSAFPGLLEILRSWQPQLLVRESAEFGALVAAEAVGVPHARVAVHHPLMEEQFCSLATAPIDVLRDVAGLAADEGAALRAEPAFTAFPASFEGTAGRGASRAPYRVGPDKKAAQSASSGWQPQRSGLPLVYITLGTLAGGLSDALQVYQTAIAAVADLPVRALLTTGRGFDVATLGAIPANLQVEAWVAQAEVFPHTALLVCHGGSGTVLGGLAAGLPQVVVPLGADQPQNAQSIAATGAGLALSKPDLEEFRAAIQRVLAEPKFRRAASVIAAEMAALPDIDDAAEALLAFAAR